MQNQSRRTPPPGMPHQPPRPGAGAMRPKPAQDAPPAQQPLTEEEQPRRRPSLLGRVPRRIGLAVLTVLALALAYVFLLLGEPDEETKYAHKAEEQRISMPMAALDVPGESDAQRLADSFDQPVLALNGQLTMHKSRIYDTAFDGGYARCVSITYTFADGQTLLVESLRPTGAVALLKQRDYMLDASALYTIGGLNAARMQDEKQICVFAQSDTAVYAVTCPAAHADELPGLLRYTTLIAPSAGD